MNPDTKELTFEESFKQVMQTLPPVIRNYVAQEKYTPVVMKVVGKYGLRIDQAGVLEREVMLLLIGVETPDEFVQALATEASLDQGTIDGISQDVNDQIFVPLRKEEERGGMGAVQPTRSALSASEYVPPQPRVAPSFVPQQQRVAQPRFAPSVTQAPNRTLEDHEEPHIEFKSAPAMSVPAAAPRVFTPPVNLPGAMPPQVVQPSAPVIPAGTQVRFTPPARPTVNALSPDYQPGPPRTFAMPAMPESPVAPPPAPAPVMPVVQQRPAAPISVPNYSADPYREPFDDESTTA